MNSQPAVRAAAQPRLNKEQFVALRSLAKGRWVQGQQIEWKFNRSWRFVKFSKTSLDAVFSLQLRGLATKGKCCLKCRRDVFLLTEAGLKFINEANSPGQQLRVLTAAAKKPSITARVLYWLGR